MAKLVVGLDIETVDPLLKTAGYSWKYGSCGYILATALYFEAEDKISVVPGLINSNCPWGAQARRDADERIKNLLKNHDHAIVGADKEHDHR